MQRIVPPQPSLNARKRTVRAELKFQKLMSVHALVAHIVAAGEARRGKTR